MLNFDIDKEYASFLDAAAQQIKESIGEVEELHLQGGQDKKILMLLATVAKILSALPDKKESILKRAGFNLCLASDLENIEKKLQQISDIKDKVDSLVLHIGKSLKDNYYSKDNNFWESSEI